MPDVAVKFLKKVFREGGYIPSDFWCDFEVCRIDTDDKETLSNFSTERCMFCLSYFILAKVLVSYILLKPNTLRGINITKHAKKASKLVASVLYHIYKELIIEDFESIVIQSKVKGSSSSEGDEFITDRLFAKNELKYIYEYQQSWAAELKHKLKNWMQVLCTLIGTSKFNKYRTHEETFVGFD